MLASSLFFNYENLFACKMNKILFLIQICIEYKFPLFLKQIPWMPFLYFSTNLILCLSKFSNNLHMFLWFLKF